MLQAIREWIRNYLLPKPVSKYRGIGIYRCQADGYLVTGTQRELRAHAGHHMRTPTTLTLKEKLWIRLGLIGK